MSTPPSGFAAICSSHAPLALRIGLDHEGRTRFSRSLARMAAWVEDFAPEVVVEFAPDHFNGFFYDAMPNFCLATAATAVGDWGGIRGQLPVPEQLALDALNFVRLQDIDLDLSRAMQVDHGFVQMWEIMLGRLDRFPIVPIMINCVAPPRASFRRARLLGAAIGRFAANSGRRILFAGSGGLSHDPPIPVLNSATDAQRAWLMSGRNLSSEARAAREDRVTRAAAGFKAGTGGALAPNPDWDQQVIELLSSGRLSDMDTWSEEWVTQTGGCGGHEVRTWLATFAALAEASGGRYRLEVDYYEVVSEWMTGMAVCHANS